jgi:hypothetical protein
LSNLCYNILQTVLRTLFQENQVGKIEKAVTLLQWRIGLEKTHKYFKAISNVGWIVKEGADGRLTNLDGVEVSLTIAVGSLVWCCDKRAFGRVV